MKVSSRKGVFGAAVAALAMSAVAILPASAADNTISSNLTGDLTITLADTSTLVLNVPDGSSFNGNWDDASGELTGEVDIAGGSFTTSITDPAATDINISYEFTSGGPITNGTIDPVTNVVEFDDVQTLTLTELEVVLLAQSFPLAPTCSFADIALHYTGTYDPATGIVDVTSQVLDDLTLTGVCGTILDLVNVEDVLAPMLDGATAVSSLQFTVAVEEITTTTTTSTTSTTMPDAPIAPTPPTTLPDSGIAEPVAGAPSYTG